MKAVGLFTVKLTTSKTVATYVYGPEKHSQTSQVQYQHSFSLPPFLWIMTG